MLHTLGKEVGMGSWFARLPRASLGWLALVRITVGLAMLSNGINKFGVKLEGGPPGANWLVNATPLRTILDGATKSPAVDPLYRSFLETVALPNAEVFAVLIAVGETLVGLSLTLGLLTRLGGFGGAFLHLNYMLMKGLLSHGGYIDRVFFVLEIMLAVTAAGYVLGLDGLLRASMPTWLRALMSPAPEEEAIAAPARQQRVQPA
jgi:thiosulfate dehydrogenase [quinone] large subunit